jgi:hypothetical protein
MKRALLVVISIFLSTMSAYGAVPVCMYQDVQSGPASGGEGGNGVYLNIYGVNFGATQGSSTVAVNGTPVSQYLYWGADPTGERQQIGVQIASGTTSGKITVTTAAGSCSNLSFTVRAGHIWFIGPNVDDSAPGTAAEMKASNSYSSPWGLTNSNVPNTNGGYNAYRTPYTYYECCVAPGDFLVFLGGVNYPYFDGRGWGGSLTLDQATTASSFITLQGRPGGTAILGGGETNINAISNTWSGGYTVYSGLTLVGQGSNGSALNMWNYDRAVGNTLSCPSCRDEAGGGITAAEGAADGIEALGNEISQVSTNTALLPNGSNKQFHDVYVAGNNWEFAWNRINSTAGYNGVQVNEDGVSGFYNFSIHDNDIADVNGSGINLSDIDPSSGFVQVYNNVIHHTGIALASDGGSDDPHSCIAVKGYGGSTGTGTVQIYNNTMYDCSSYLNATGSASSEGESCAIFIPANQLNVTTNMVNNIAYEPSYAHTSVYNVFICGDGTAGSISGSNNIWYSGSTPGSTAYATSVGTIENPLFVNASNGALTNFGLQGGSPARGAGTSVGPVQSQKTNNSQLTWDFNQVVRPTQPSVGAFEYGATSSVVLISISATPTPAVLGQTVTLTSTVAQTGTSVPSGSVTFMNGSASLGQASLDSAGTATLTLSSLSAGSYAVLGSYSGDSHYASGKSAVASLQVISSTTVSLTATPNPVTAGQALTLVATLSASGATPTSGTVNFLNGSTVLGSASLNAAGVATLSTTALPAGTYSLVAQYAGSSSFVASTSAAVSVTVNASTATSAISLVATPNPVSTGQVLTLMATVSVTGTTPASGTVHFMNGSTLLGSASLNPSGVATLSTTSLPAGTYSLVAQYAGNSSLPASTSPAVSVTVNVSAMTTSTSLVATPNSVAAGQTLNLIATVSVTGTTPASGTIRFMNGSVLLGSASLNGSGVATLSTANLPAGSYSLVAQYAGNSSFPASTSPAVPVTVNASAATTTISLAATPNPVVAGAALTLVATVTTTGTTPVSGPVSFMNGSTPLGSANLNSSGVATLTTASLPAGTYSLVAQYPGNSSPTPQGSGSTASAPTVSAAVLVTVNAPIAPIAPSFSLTAGESTPTMVTPGQTATYTLTLSPTSGPTLPAITLSATGLPAGATAKFSPPTIAAGSAAMSVTLSITAPPVQSARLENTGKWDGKLPVAALCLLLLPFGRRIRRRSKLFMRLSLLVFLFAGVASVAGLTGCSSDFRSISPQTYTVTVTSAAVSESQTAIVKLAVE